MVSGSTKHLTHTDSQSIQGISDEFCEYVLQYMGRQISRPDKIPRMIIEDVSGGKYVVHGRNISCKTSTAS